MSSVTPFLTPRPRLPNSGRVVRPRLAVGLRPGRRASGDVRRRHGAAVGTAVEVGVFGADVLPGVAGGVRVVRAQAEGGQHPGAAVVLVVGEGLAGPLAGD